MRDFTAEIRNGEPATRENGRCYSLEIGSEKEKEESEGREGGD